MDYCNSFYSLAIVKSLTNTNLHLKSHVKYFVW